MYFAARISVAAQAAEEPMPNRRSFLRNSTHLCATAIAGTGIGLPSNLPTDAAEGQRFLLVGLVGSENPTRANFPFVWAAALREGGNEVRIELAGDATVLMRSEILNREGENQPTHGLQNKESNAGRPGGD